MVAVPAHVGACLMQAFIFESGETYPLGRRTGDVHVNAQAAPCCLHHRDKVVPVSQQHLELAEQAPLPNFGFQHIVARFQQDFELQPTHHHQEPHTSGLVEDVKKASSSERRQASWSVAHHTPLKSQHSSVFPNKSAECHTTVQCVRTFR